METFVKQLIDVWNSHDSNQVAALYAAEYEGQDVAQAYPQRGIEGLRSTLASYWRAFPDLHFTLEHFMATEDQLALFWTATGTHRGPFLNIPATGHRIEVRGAAYHQLHNDKIVYSLYIWDTAGLLRTIKLLPDLIA